jgi:class 3 adenylate cyclase
MFWLRNRRRKQWRERIEHEHSSRIEGLNKQFGTSICISDSVHKRVAGRIVARVLGRVPVKGRQTELMIYELLGIAGSADPELCAVQTAA